MDDISALRRPATNGQKWLAALILGILFVILASGPVFQLTNQILTSIFGEKAATEINGKPTVLGLILHGVVFLLIVRLLLY